MRYKLVRYGDEVIRVRVTSPCKSPGKSLRVSSPPGRVKECSKVEPWEYTWLPWIAILVYMALQGAAIYAAAS